MGNSVVFFCAESLEERCLMSSHGLVGAAIPAVTTGGSYYVSPTGKTTNSGTQRNPWPSVAYALGKVGGGNTIILEAGTYAPILVPLGDGGTSAHPTVIKAQTKWQAVINGALTPTVGGITTQTDGTGGNTDYVTIDGFKVVNAGTVGIALGGNWDIVQNCWVTGGKGEGIAAVAVSNDTIRNNLVEHNGTSTQSDDGIYASGSGLVISGNIVRHNAAFGVQLSPSAQSSTVTGNLVYGQQSQADIVLNGSQTNTVTSNTILDSAVDGIQTYGPNPVSVWTGNRVESSISGATLDSVSSSTVSDYSRALSRILPALATTDNILPTATVSGSGLNAGNQMVQVTYSDNLSLALPTIGLDDVVITGPGGYSAAPSSIVQTYMPNSRTLVVTYDLAAPSGGWTSANNGTYGVSLQSKQISDVAGNYALAGAIAGGFGMTFAAAPPPPVAPPPVAPPPTVTSYYVSPTGSTSNAGTESSPWPTVTYALSQVGGGHTIILEPGTYTPILVTRGNGGTSASPTVIESQYRWQAVVDGTGYPNAGYASLEGVVSESNGAGETTDYVTFDGLKIINAAGVGIALGGNYDVAEDCWITNCKGGGIGAYGPNYTVIQDNLIEYSGTSTQYDHGIYVGGNGLLISGNIIRHISGFGMTLYPSIQNSTITNNLVYGQTSQADVVIEGPTASNTFTNNVFLDSLGGVQEWGPSPFEAWSGNRVEPTISGASLDSISSNNVADYASALSLILPSLPAQDLTPPSAAVFDSGLYFGTQTVWVRYTDNQSMTVQQINPGNVIITGPNGYSAAPQSIEYMIVQDARTLEVTYALTPPAGGWTSAYDGTYTVTLLPNQVSDLAGNYVPAGAVGTFKMTI